MDTHESVAAGRDPVVTAWFLLILLSAGSFAAIEGGLITAIASVIVVVIAAWKARFIMVYFMEIKSVGRNWQALYSGWILAVAAMLLVGNFVAMLKA